MDNNIIIFKGYRTAREVSVEDVCKDVGPGWSKIIESLLSDLFALNWDGVVLQVKEKFGGLRFYIEQNDAAIHDRIRVAEQSADATCEYCGAPGELRHTSWLKTLCDPCHIAREEARQKEDEELKKKYPQTPFTDLLAAYLGDRRKA